jgi:alginate O-acetyltransferase complex protein AlgI
VDQIYNKPQDYSGWPLIGATYLFAFQIYCDFSGYTDIARGCARVMGCELMENFKRPYFATSISEFWRRWHISLFSWFRDYLYLPLALGGNKSEFRLYASLFIVFAVSGIWHGAAVTFLVWGALHGLYMVCSALKSKVVKKPKNPSWLRQAMGIFITFHLVTFSWIFFRSNLSGAYHVVTHLFAPTRYLIPPNPTEWLICVVLILGLLMVEAFQGREPVGQYLGRHPMWFRWAAYYLAVLAILLLGKFDMKQFIYFQF